MKAAEAKTSHSNPSQQSKGGQPFFKKGGNESFLSNEMPQAGFFFSPSTIQAKLTIGAPNDPYEQEADAMAEKVVQRLSADSGPLAVSSPAVQLKCAACEEEERVQKKEGEEADEELPTLQRKAIFESNEEQPPVGAVQRKAEGGALEASPDLERRLGASRGGGQSLPEGTRSSMESAFGTDFSGVRVHTGSEAVQLNRELGAQAFTHGSDVYFGAGKYDPGSTEGQRLLGHELTHVVQQGGGVQRKMIQCDFAPQSLPTSNGVFEFEMETREGLLAPAPLPAGAKSGVRGNIKFDPATTAPYSNEITLIQIVKLTDSGTGDNVNSGTMVPGRDVRTTEVAGNGVPGSSVEGGFLTDVEHRRGGVDAAPGSALAPQYPFGPGGGSQVIGFKRSDDPADIKKAELFDFPGTRSATHNLDFEFETVAKGEDTNTVYGSLNWSFGIRAGDVVNEQVNAADAQSGTFDEALELHRDFYVHEPVTFYFGFDQDTLEATEIAKIDGFLDYLTRFPDVRLSLTGYADRRGSADYNLDLSLRRAENVKQALLDKGIEEGKIDDIILGMGATEEHTSGDRAPNAGRSQDLEANRRGNRRVTLTFEHTQSFPGP